MNELTREEMVRWIKYGILHYGLDGKIIDEILFDVSEDDEERYQFACEILSRTSEKYFELGYKVAKMI